MARRPTHFGFRPFPKRGAIVTNELIDELRDGDALDRVQSSAEIGQDTENAVESKVTALPTVRDPMNFEIECEREDDGRWLAEVPQLPGVLAYGSTADQAMARAEALALRVLAGRIEQGETGPRSISISVAAW